MTPDTVNTGQSPGQNQSEPPESPQDPITQPRVVVQMLYPLQQAIRLPGNVLDVLAAEYLGEGPESVLVTALSGYEMADYGPVLLCYAAGEEIPATVETALVSVTPGPEGAYVFLLSRTPESRERGASREAPPEPDLPEDYRYTDVDTDSDPELDNTVLE